MPTTPWPAGFRAHVGSIGIKGSGDDMVVLAAEGPVPAAAVFTRSRFEGPSVTLSREHVADGRLQAFVVIARNANVATGDQGRLDAAEVVASVASAIGATPDDVAIASTGVIGRPYPMDRVRAHLADLAGADLRPAGRGGRARGPGHDDHRHRGQGGLPPRWGRPASWGWPRAWA